MLLERKLTSKQDGSGSCKFLIVDCASILGNSSFHINGKSRVGHFLKQVLVCRINQ